MSTELRNRPEKENPVHTATEIYPGVFVINRNKAPFIEILYSISTGDHQLKSMISNEVPTQSKIDAAIKKAVAWAKHNIKS